MGKVVHLWGENGVLGKEPPEEYALLEDSGSDDEASKDNIVDFQFAKEVIEESRAIGDLMNRLLDPVDPYTDINLYAEPEESEFTMVETKIIPLFSQDDEDNTEPEDNAEAAMYEVEPEDDEYDDADASDEDEDEEESGSMVGRLRDIELPTGLQHRFFKDILFAVVVAIVTIILLIRFQTIQCCIGFAVVGFLLFKAIELKFDFRDGKIQEAVVTCASLRYNAFSHTLHVTFRDDGEDEDAPVAYYTFHVPERNTSFLGRKRDSGESDFEVNHVYVIYYKINEPSNLLGYVEL